MNRLVIIDGNAILHRAYHALPKLTNKNGEVINAVYGFASMLLRIVNDIKPSHLVVAFDVPGPSFREALYEKYQATRPKIEDDLVSQIGKVHDLVEQLKIPIFEKEGYEADDVIGTLARQATEDTKRKDIKILSEKEKIDHLVSQYHSISVSKPSDFEVVIVSGDRDMLQLVDEKTRIYMPVKGLSESKMYDRQAVKEKYGLKPEQVVDLKALTGDPSDNYPGVAGIGPKTAQNLLTYAGSLERLYKDLDSLKEEYKISDKTVHLLKEGKKDAEVSKKLATIERNAPVNFEENKARWHNEADVVEKVLLDFGFKTLAKRAGGNNKQITNNSKQKEVKKTDDSQLGLF